MQVPVTVEVPDEILEDSLRVLSHKYKINLNNLDQQEQFNTIAQAISNEILKDIVKQLAKEKHIEEYQRLSSFLPQNNVSEVTELEEF